jgi:hypothetical protein
MDYINRKTKYLLTGNSAGAFHHMYLSRKGQQQTENFPKEAAISLISPEMDLAYTPIGSEPVIGRLSVSPLLLSKKTEKVIIC